MSQIRRQSIISTFLIGIGFIIGFINQFLFGHDKWFSTVQYGLTRSFFDFGQIIFVGSFWGMSSVIYKFFPYYEAHTKKKENDLLSLALLISTAGFLLFLFLGTEFDFFFVRKFNQNSPLLVHYYYWLYPFGFGLLIFSIMESYCWCLHRTIITNFLKETALRILTSVLIGIYISGIINFDSFIKLFSLLYIAITAFLIVVLVRDHQLHLTFRLSRVTLKFKKKIAVFALFLFGGTLLSVLSSLIDSIIIASVGGQVKTGIFSFNNYVSNLIQIPQRSVIAITIPVLAVAWREKNIEYIRTIYQRTSINLLLISLFIFGIIWLNYADGISVLDLNKDFLEGKWLAFFMALKYIIDMGTGVNGQIIVTSQYWRFEFLTGILLLALMSTLNYILIKAIGITGAGISNLIAYTIYNAIRIWFLWKKYRIQPFNIKTTYTIFIALSAYFLAYYGLYNFSGWHGLILRSLLFTSVYSLLVWKLKITPDLMPVLNSIKKRLGLSQQ